MANNVNIVNRGFEYICQWMANTAGTGYAAYTTPTFIGWGGANGYNASSTALPATAASTTVGTGQWSDVGPYQELSEPRVAGTVGMTANSSGSGTVGYVLTGTMVASTSESVGESFLVMSSTKPTAWTISGNQTSPTATALTVTSITGAPSTPFYMQMNNEVIQVSNASTTVLTIARGQNGSAAGTAKSGDIITVGNIPGAGIGNPSKGDMFAHAGFQALALNSSDSIAFTWTVSVTS